PYVNSPSEPFDTAVVLLALVRQGDAPGVKAMLRRGRAYLVAAQQRDGSWPETTRPAGQESYAERLSTAGWATLAPLATAEARRGRAVTRGPPGGRAAGRPAPPAGSGWPTRTPRTPAPASPPPPAATRCSWTPSAGTRTPGCRPGTPAAGRPAGTRTGSSRV